MWWNLKRPKRPVVLSAACLGFLIGIGLAKSPLSLSTVFSAALLTAIIMARTKWRLLISCFCLMACLGCFRGTQFLTKLHDYQPIYGQTLVFEVTAKSDAVYGYSKQLTFDAKDLTINGKRYFGKLSIAGFGENMVFQGDRLTVRGKIRPARGSYIGRASYVTMKVGDRPPNMINDWRRRFGAALTTVLPEPLAPFGMGLLIGQRNTLPMETSETLLWVGLSHIIAVSGYNLTILLQASKKLLTRGSKFQITALSIGLILTFLLFAGDSPSIVRAAIVSIISLIAWYYGRAFKPLLIILVTAVITSAANPTYVWSDSGWYLSFLAFFGILVVAPLAHAWVPERFGNSLIGGMMVESLCAEVMTMPYVLFVFGQTSLVALWANILVASFVPLAMLTTMIAGLAGMLVPLAAGWFAWPANWILNYMLDACAILAGIPHVFIDNHYLGLSGLLLWYGALAVLCVVIRHRGHGIITDRNKYKSEELKQ